jgi:hypothetical protein
MLDLVPERWPGEEPDEDAAPDFLELATRAERMQEDAEDLARYWEDE